MKIDEHRSPGPLSAGLRAALRNGSALVLLLTFAVSVTGCAREVQERPGEPQPGGTLDAFWKPSRSSDEAIPVVFSFHREQLGEGRIAIRLGPEGKRFVGQYLRLTGKRPLARIRIFHTFWQSEEFSDFATGPAGAPFDRRITIEQFQQRYTGSVLARLIGEGGGSMRCTFELANADGGLADGARGRCQDSFGGITELVGRRPAPPLENPETLR